MPYQFRWLSLGTGILTVTEMQRMVMATTICTSHCTALLNMDTVIIMVLWVQEKATLLQDLLTMEDLVAHI